MDKPNKIFRFFESKTIDELQGLPDVGPEVARSIFEYFHNHRNEKFIEKLSKAGVRIKTQNSKLKTQKLAGKIFVLTGVLNSMTREQAKEKIRQLGGDVSESVARKTSFVVVGQEPGSKYEKAKELGVNILEEKEFLSLIRA